MPVNLSAKKNNKEVPVKSLSENEIITNHCALLRNSYSGLFKYSWHCSGYIAERGEKFPNPANFAKIYPFYDVAVLEGDFSQRLF